jgi:hypothetical protein
MSQTAIQIDLRGSTLMDILINEKHSWELRLEHFEDDGTTPLALTGTYKMQISTKENNENVVMTLENGSGLTVAANVLTINRTVVQNTLGRGTFYYDIRSDFGDGTSIRPYYGRIIISPNVTGE